MLIGNRAAQYRTVQMFGRLQKIGGAAESFDVIHHSSHYSNGSACVPMRADTIKPCSHSLQICMPVASPMHNRTAQASVMKRAIRSQWIIFDEMDLMWAPIVPD